MDPSHLATMADCDSDGEVVLSSPSPPPQPPPDPRRKQEMLNELWAMFPRVSRARIAAMYDQVAAANAGASNEYQMQLCVLQLLEGPAPPEPATPVWFSLIS